MQTPLIDACLAIAHENRAAGDVAGGGVFAAADRRRSERVNAAQPAWVSGESADRSARGRDVTVNDLSMGGLGFHDSKTSYRIGACHWLVMNSGAPRLSTRIRIVSCRQNDTGGYDVGAKFY